MFEKLKKYLQEVRVEMAKATWPTREELLNSTTVVIVVSLVFAVFIFGADQVIKTVLGLVFKMK